MPFFLRLLRSVLATGFLLLFTAIYSFVLTVTLPFIRRRSYGDFFLRTWGRALIKAYGIDLQVQGLENLPSEGAILLFNHSSHFDIIAICAGIPKSARFGAKIELFKIPIFGHAMKYMNVLPIRRGERDRVLQLYEESVPRLHAGESFYLAAEGRRQPEDGVGDRFKSGPFIFAISAQAPIVPVVLKGAGHCLPKGDLLPCTRHRRIQLKVLTPVPTKGLSQDDRPRLQEDVRRQMTEAYQSL